MIFEGTINAGNLITLIFGAVIWLVTIALAWAKFGNRLSLIELRLELMEKAVTNIGLILEKFATNEKDVLLLKQQVTALEADYSALNTTIEGLRRGEGYIQLRRRNTVDGEYPVDARS